MEIITKSAGETQKAGEDFADYLKKNFAGKAVVLGLVGDLGAGKTTFVQGLAKGLGIKSRIISPTFILLRQYKEKKLTFYHIDLYRLEGDIARELEGLGIGEFVNDPGNVLAVEWAEKAKDFLPKDTIWVDFLQTDDTRRINIKL